MRRKLLVRIVALVVSTVCALGGALSPDAAAAPGVITTVAGGTGSGAPLTVGQFPMAVAAGRSGRLYIADPGWSVVRRVAGKPPKERTVAGNGTVGFAGDGGPAVDAGFGSVTALGSPVGVQVDATGNLFVADNDNNRVRMVAGSTGVFYGVSTTQGDIYTVAGDGNRAFFGDGGPATAAEL